MNPAYPVIGCWLAPLIGSGLLFALRRRRSRYRRLLVAASCLVGLLATGVLWPVVQPGPLQFYLGSLGVGGIIGLRLDALSLLAIGVLLGFAGTILVTAPDEPFDWGWMLCLSVAVLGVEASGLWLLTASWGLTAVLIHLGLATRDQGQAPQRSWIAQQGATLLLLGGTTFLLATTGTDQYAAIPVARMGLLNFGLIAVAALARGGFAPWPTTALRLWRSQSPTRAGLVHLLLISQSIYLLIRLYLVAEGVFPASWLQLALFVVGLSVLAGAVSRASAWRHPLPYLVEGIALSQGFVLIGLAVDDPLGLITAMSALVGIGGLVTFIALADLESRWQLGAGYLLVLGMPPALTGLIRAWTLLAVFDAGSLWVWGGALATVIWAAYCALAISVVQARRERVRSLASAALIPLMVLGAAGIVPQLMYQYALSPAVSASGLLRLPSPAELVHLSPQLMAPLGLALLLAGLLALLLVRTLPGVGRRQLSVGADPERLLLYAASVASDAAVVGRAWTWFSILVAPQLTAGRWLELEGWLARNYAWVAVAVGAGVLVLGLHR